MFGESACAPKRCGSATSPSDCIETDHSIECPIVANPVVDRLAEGFVAIRVAGRATIIVPLIAVIRWAASYIIASAVHQSAHLWLGEQAFPSARRKSSRLMCDGAVF